MFGSVDLHKPCTLTDMGETHTETCRADTHCKIITFRPEKVSLHIFSLPFSLGDAEVNRFLLSFIDILCLYQICYLIYLISKKLGK